MHRRYNNITLSNTLNDVLLKWQLEQKGWDELLKFVEVFGSEG